MKSKKILAVLMAAGMTLSLAACGSSSDSTDKSADNGSDSGKTYKIGILQQLEHAALDEATKGFEDACTKSSEKAMSNSTFRTARASRLTVLQSQITS